MRRTTVTLLASALLAALPAAPAAAQEASAETVQLVVQSPSGDAAEAVARLGAQVDVVSETAADEELVSVGVPADQVDEALALLDSDPAVATAEPDVLARAFSDPRLPEQWGLHRTSVPAAWGSTTGDRAVVVAVLDSGVNQSASDLRGAHFVSGYDFVNGDANPHDDHGHGTNSAGVIAAQPDNGIGGVGVCPRCSIMPVKVLAKNGWGSHFDIAAGIRWATDEGAAVINMSLGGPGGSSHLQEAVRYATAAGVVVVASAGNDGHTTKSYPAGYPETVSVAASDGSDRRMSWSNHGRWVRVAAPGCNWSVQPLDQQFCGTSSAAPIVAGIAGLLRSARPTASRGDVEGALETGATPVPYVAAGRVDAVESLAGLPGGGPENQVQRITAAPSAPKVTAGRRVRLSGRVVTGGTATGSVPVVLRRREAGGSWSVAAVAATDAAGRFSFTDKPARSATYRLTGGQVDSPTVAVTVKSVATLRGPSRALRRGGVARLTGRVAPAGSGTAIQLQVRKPSGWRTVAKVRSSSGKAVFDVRSTMPGTHRYRVRLPAGRTWTRAVSAPVTVRTKRR